MRKKRWLKSFRQWKKRFQFLLPLFKVNCLFSILLFLILLSINQVRKMKERMGKKNIKKSDSTSPGGSKIKPGGAISAAATKKVTEVDLFSSPSSSASKAK